ncbi:MAG: adenylate/guanylate cyclase domain-containing protein [Leptolyngbyaceae cyanobacterium bins.59]|nr:adenylate/guanylate cyclase domain-containing protein [Leptolyngbyaceae cyanobacterium bins.59]
MTTDRSLQLNTRSELNRLLERRIQWPEQSEQIDAEIRRRFAQIHAVVVLDMAGFSRRTATQGIIPTLSLIHQMNCLAACVVEESGGEIIKLEADNIFAIFPDVSCAVETSVAILEKLLAMNLEASVGIGYGELLMVVAGDQYGNDIYGNEMNLASKLGEDLAEHGEILITESAYQAWEGSNEVWVPVDFLISHLQIRAYRWQCLPVLQ